MITAVIGLQWGDEGKGKIIDYLSKDFDIVARFQGGPNAGHTIKIKDEEFIFHQLPSGLFNENIKGVIGAGVVIDLERLVREIEMLENRIGKKLEKDRLLIDGRATLILDFHRWLDYWEEELQSGVGSTRRGIAPSYKDRYLRKAVRLGDIDKREFREKLRELVEYNNQVLAARYGKPPFDFNLIYKKIMMFWDRIRDYVGDVVHFMMKSRYKNILLEGAQGVLLDIFFGTYPFVTSSHTHIGGALVGLGVRIEDIKRIIGVCKAYTTRVGKGPFPTEIKGELAKELRDIGGEYGATTRRPRRVGWLDIPLLRYSTFITSATEIFLTKIDVLERIKKVKIGIKYKLGNKIMDFPPYSIEDWFDLKVLYEEMEFDEKEYVKLIEKNVGIKVSMVSCGKEREKIREPKR